MENQIIIKLINDKTLFKGYIFIFFLYIFYLIIKDISLPNTIFLI